MKLIRLMLLAILFSAAFPVLPQSGNGNPHGKIRWDCINCHTTDSWREMKRPLDFQHAETGFQLSGAHRYADCMSCHETPRFSEVGSACADCHTDVHKGELGQSCQSCHTLVSWENRLDHLGVHAARGFPLTGAHAVADCQSCHVSEQHNEFSGMAMACFSCHMDDYATTLNPDHKQAGFAFDCENCHLPAAINWTDNVRYDHSTSFALRGAHQRTDCLSCHESQFTGTPSACYSCHEQEFSAAEFPDHQALGFPTDCAGCHTENAWQGAQFDHIGASGFSLNGAHAVTQCTNCHVNNQLAGLPRECFGCHEQDYRDVDVPNHVQNNFPTDCMSCHNENVWSPADFDHNMTSFPLTGEHIAIQCADCHENGEFTALPTDCYACHQQDYENTGDLDHVANGFSFECTDCHTTSGWEPATFEHTQTNFPLTGAHQPLDCISCHSQGYVNTPEDCYACHQQDYEDTDDPDHVANGFSFECTDCHTTSGWDPATFEHAQTNFPLTGAHQQLDCMACHNQGYVNTSEDCAACHETDYQNLNNPDHVAAGFSLQCEVCHATSAWSPSSWTHSQTGFVLTGAHNVLTCLECHSEGYAATPVECVGCHEADFQGTVNPNHIAAGFPLQCATCHTTTAWSPANWDHDGQYFPINSGKHRGEWDACVDCHVNPANYAVFECIFCHEHNRADTDNDHDEVANYVYESIACFNCHPTGEELILLDRIRQ